VFKTTRIAAVLAFAFVCVPAHALSMKDYEAKSDADKLRYLQICVGNLVNDLAKADRPLSLKVRSYYYDKLPGYPYPEGTYDLLGRIVKLEQQAEKDKSIDLSKIRIEEVVALTTAAKFKIPVPPDFQRTADPPVTPRPAAPVPVPAPAPAPASRPADPVDDPIGPGGFITPPDSPRKPADDDPIGPGGFITPPTPPMQICVSADFVPLWENPSANPEMEAFRGLIGDYILAYGKSGEQYRIKSNAFVTFESARRAASAYTPAPKIPC
jgi:hypothetical protein